MVAYCESNNVMLRTSGLFDLCCENRIEHKQRLSILKESGTSHYHCTLTSSIPYFSVTILPPSEIISTLLFKLYQAVLTLLKNFR